MRITCEFCGGYLEDTDVNCPNCNAPNKHLSVVQMGYQRQ